MKKKLNVIFLYMFFCVSKSINAQCPIGNVYFNSQSDVDSFIINYPNCSIINGSLYIVNASTSDPIVDLSSLDYIEEVKNDFWIDGTNEDELNSFIKLISVGGDFVIDNNRELIIIENFSNLETVGGDFIINENHVSLKSIRGFDRLTTIEGNFSISNNNSQLEYISEFQNLHEVKGWFSISYNNGLKKIEGFNRLIEVGNTSNIIGLNIHSNNFLEKINGFNSLKKVTGNIKIQQNVKLTEVLGFSLLGKVTYQIVFNSCPLLKKIPEFENLLRIGSGLELTDLGLVEMVSFDNVEIIGDLDPSWGNLYVSANDNLLKISGFEKLKVLKGELGITTNKKLIDLIGFYNLIETRGLNIVGNDSLINLVGLESLNKVGSVGSNSISIRRNTMLSDCSAICNLLTNGTVLGTVNIIGNPSKCSSESEVREECIPDFDNDSILDDDDLDDDNDGILDTIEQNGDINRDTDSDGFPDHKDLDSDNDGCFDVIEAGFEDSDNNGTLGSLPDNINTQGLIINEVTGYTIPLDVNSNNIRDFQENTLLSAGSDGFLSICKSSSSVDLYNSLGGSPDLGGVWTPSLSSGTGVFDPNIDVSGIYTYTVANGVCGSTSSKVDVDVLVKPSSGLDGVLSICNNSSSVNLYDSLGGIPDLGGVWTPSLSSGTGVFDPNIDSSGTYIYTVTNGVCGSVSSKIKVNVFQAPSSGQDGVLLICNDSSSVDLYNSLGGAPDLGGVWTPNLSSGSGVFDPSIDSSGIYTYTITDGVCGRVSSTVEVNILQRPKSGNDGVLSICTSSSSVDLYDSLGGTPDLGGEWTPTLSSGTGVFDPSIDGSGTYIYTVTNGVCEAVSSKVEVNVSSDPISGLDGVLSICNSSNSVDLYDSLGGTPDLGGVWTPSLSSGSGVFDPSLDSSGLYTYTVTDGICGAVSSTVDVNVFTEYQIDKYDIKIKGYNDIYNSIEIIIDKEGVYEFSLDGHNYKTDNIFNDLEGGNYTVYVREIGGCGKIEKKVSIIDYPRFFTPNGDGINDLWELEGNISKSYSLFIYDRYGKLLKEMNNSESSWDGTYMGETLPPNDYWFQIIFDSGEIIKGNFSLLIK